MRLRDGKRNSVELFNYTHTFIFIYLLFKKSKIYIKTFKCSYMFRSHDHHQVAYIVFAKVII